MQDKLPPDIVTTPGSMSFNFIQPTAIEKAELIESHLMDTLMLMYPMWAYDEWLDYHASSAGIARKAGVPACGILTVTGPYGTVIEAGTLFTTVGNEDTEAKEYICNEEYTLDESGTLDISITAVQAGVDYNALAGTITLMDKPIDGVFVVNNKNIAGGVDEEGDESLRERIQEKNENIETSYVGSIADYKRWAKECTGVGNCIVQDVWDGPGTVRLIITDSSGKPVSENTLQTVYNYIANPDVPEERLLPAGGVELSVITLTEFSLTYAGSIILVRGYTLNEVVASFNKKLLDYYIIAKSEGVLKYNKVCAILSSLAGIDDFENLLINNEISNIVIPEEVYPVTVDTILQEA